MKYLLSAAACLIVPIPVLAASQVSDIADSGWLIISVLLIAAIFSACFAEIKSAGSSGGTILAIPAFMALYWLFGSDHFSLSAALCLLFGLAAIISDIFLFMSGFVSLLGLLGIAGSVFLLMGADSMALSLTAFGLLAAMLVTLLFLRYIPNGKLWKRLTLSLQSTSQQGYVPGIDYRAYLHQTGTAVTPLRPSGSILIGTVRLDVVTSGDFLPVGTTVRIISVTGNRLLVEPVTETIY